MRPRDDYWALLEQMSGVRQTMCERHAHQNRNRRPPCKAICRTLMGSEGSVGNSVGFVGFRRQDFRAISLEVWADNLSRCMLP